MVFWVVAPWNILTVADVSECWRGRQYIPSKHRHTPSMLRSPEKFRFHIRVTTSNSARYIVLRIVKLRYISFIAEEVLILLCLFRFCYSGTSRTSRVYLSQPRVVSYNEDHLFRSEFSCICLLSATDLGNSRNWLLQPKHTEFGHHISVDSQERGVPVNITFRRRNSCRRSCSKWTELTKSVPHYAGGGVDQSV